MLVRLVDDFFLIAALVVRELLFHLLGLTFVITATVVDCVGEPAVAEETSVEAESQVFAAVEDLELGHLVLEPHLGGASLSQLLVVDCQMQHVGLGAEELVGSHSH